MRKQVQTERLISAEPQRIWELWTDVAGSPRWDTDVEWSRLFGRFAVGTRGEFRLKNGPKVSFELTEVEPQRAFANVIRLPGLAVTFTHQVEQVAPRKVRVRHGADFSGPVGWLLGALVGRKLERTLAQALRNMATLAEDSN